MYVFLSFTMASIASEIVFLFFVFNCFRTEGSNFRPPKMATLDARDVMEIYRNKENVKILVPENPNFYHPFVHAWVKNYRERRKQFLEGKKTISRRLEGSAEVHVETDEDDSLELLDLEDSPKPSFDGYGPPPVPSDFQHCGFTPVHHATYPGSHFRVVGGRKAKPESWPWMAALGYTRGSAPILEFHCGGTLISDRHVVTAAHCVLIPHLTLKAVRLGVVQLTDRNWAQDYLISRVIHHPGFNWTTASNDLAVVFFQEAVPFSATVHPICLPQGKMQVANFENTFPFVTGWGLTEDRKPSAWLKELRMPVVPTEVCQNAYKNLPKDRAIPVTDGQLCCGFKEGGRDACQGDSGGPLMLPSGYHPRGEVYFLIGVVSLGEGCAQPGVPGVFTRITSYLDWLSEVTGLPKDQNAPFDDE